jgi:hypothetical protein
VRGFQTDGALKHTLRIAAIMLASIGYGGVTPSEAQEVKFNLIDTGRLSDDTRGEGIYATFQADTLQSMDATGTSAGQQLCNAVLPQVLPWVLEKTGKTNPTFVAVTVKKGSSFVGIYWRAFYSLAEGKCGDEM